MSSATQRATVLESLDESVAAGARQARACQVLGLSVRTVQRWRRDGLEDGRPRARRPCPANALSKAERERALALLCSAKWRDLSPKQVVPRLADEGLYIASEATLYRLLRAAKLLRHRAPSRPRKRRGPRRHRATRPNRVWTWDITYLPSSVRGLFYYLYLVVDLYSRKIVAWQVHMSEDAEYAAALITEACQHQGINAGEVVLHSDNGAPMKGATLLATLQGLGVTPSFSRPRVSNDNPYSESLFRTVKYRPWYPEHPFATLADARTWVESFVAWYNHEHRHSAIRFVTPHQRHTGAERKLLERRDQVYRTARSRHPERWSGPTRNWTPVGAVWLNPPTHRRNSSTARPTENKDA